MRTTDEITELISKWQDGDKRAENALFDALYQRLHGIALNCLRSEQRDKPLGATTLVHEAYLRLHRTGSLYVHNRNHFLALIAQVMRRIVIDQARVRKSVRHGGELGQVDIDNASLVTYEEADEILAVDRALEILSKRAPRQAQLVELRYFAGFSEDEAAEILNISTRTVRRDWQIARTRLRIAIDGPGARVGLRGTETP
jgi:RNA polymerase sigma factor (TIGR02999 family)